MSKSKRLVDAETALLAALEEIARTYGTVPSAFLIAIASIPDDSGRFRRGRKPFLYRFRGHQSLNQKMAEWIAEDLEVLEEEEDEEA